MKRRDFIKQALVAAVATPAVIAELSKPTPILTADMFGDTDYTYEKFCADMDYMFRYQARAMRGVKQFPISRPTHIIVDDYEMHVHDALSKN
jgi:hypothetical protein